MDLNKLKFVGMSDSRKSSQKTGTAVCSVSVDADRPSHTSDVSQCEAAAPVLDWLCVLRLEQYSEAFYAAGMNTLQKCRNLTADQLEQMGIALPGHRRRILASVNKSDGAGDPHPQVVLSEGGQGWAETGHEKAEQGERPASIPVEEKTLQKERGKPAPKDRQASIMREEGGGGGEKQPVLDSRGGLEEEEAGGAHGGREKPVPKERTKFRCGSSMDRNPAPPVAPASDACLPPVPPRSTPNCPPQPFISPPLAQPPASPLLDRYAPVVQNRSLSQSSAPSNAHTHPCPQTHAPPILPSGQTRPQVSAIQPPARHSGGDGGSQTSPRDDRNAPPLPAKAGVIPKVPPPVPQRSPSVSNTKTVADEMQKIRTPLLPPRIKSREEPPRSGPPDVQQTVPPKMPPPPEAGLTNSELPGGTELFWFSPPGTGLDPLTGSEDHQDPDQMKLPDLDWCLQKTGPPKGANGSLSSENVDDDEPTLWQDGTLSVSEEDGSQVTAVIKTGWLSKSSPQGPPNYQRRWVKLDVDFLRYFDNEKEAYSKGFISTAFISNVSSAGELKLDIVTDNRTFVFRAESEAERDDWVAALKDTTSGRSQHRTDSIVSPLTPDCKGYLDFKGSRSKLYTVVGADKVFLYKNLEHHRLGLGITSIDMNVGNVKETDRRSFELITPYRSFSFVAESELLREQWVDAMREAIGEALSNSEVAEQIWAEPSNSRCADCGANKPDWASVNLLVVVCKQCAGEHRGLGPSISKVRSLKMDKKVWTKELIQVFLKLGNERANTFWAASVPPSEALTAFSCSEERRSFITNKYQQGKYRKYHPLYGNQRELDKALCINVQSSDVLETLSLIFCGADVNCSTGIASSLSPLSLAAAHSEHLQAELLRHNINTELPRSEVGVAMEAAHYSTPASVSHNGFLFKTASGVRVVTERKAREDFSRRWCTLSDGIFSYYESDKNPNPNRVLKSSEIVCLAVNSTVKHGYEHTFELYSESERVYLFGTADRGSHKEWVKSLAKSFIPASAEPLLRLDFERIGRLKCKDGLNLQTSKVGWFALVGSTLHVYLSDSQGEEIHLRKLNELSNRQNNEVLVLVEKGRTLYIEAERKLDFSGWCGAIQAAAGSGGDTLSQQQLTETDIPVVVHSCIGYITRCGLTSEGIYRKSGVTSRVAALCERFRRDARSVCLMEVENMVDDVSNALKRFFRDLQEGVFTSQDARAWLTTSAIQDESKKLSQYRLLLNRLPHVNKSTLQALINHLYFVQRFSEWNQMNLHNLAIVFGPTLFQTDGKDNSAGRVIEDLIQHYTLIFEVDQQQLKRQSEEITAIIILQKNSDRTCPSEPGGHLICTVYLGEKKDTAEQHVKIPGSMTAAELCIDVLDRRKIPLKEKEYWSCWEFKDKEEMERLLHYKERVLPITYGTNTHLLVKKHVAMETMMAYLANNADVSKHGVMKFREERSFLGLGRSFHDRYFIFNSSSLRMYKDVRSDNPQRNWSGKNLKVYLGIKKVLSPPTCWGLTVVCEKKQEKPEKQQWYLCCNTESEMWEWYATVLSIQPFRDVR